MFFNEQSNFSRDSFLGVVGLTTADYRTNFPAPFVLPTQIRDFPQLRNIIVAGIDIVKDGVVNLTDVSYVSGLLIPHLLRLIPLNQSFSLKTFSISLPQLLKIVPLLSP